MKLSICLILLFCALPAFATDPKKAAEAQYTYEDGSKYEGEMLDGLPHGTGTRTWADGSVYKGSLLYGEIMGEGSLKKDNNTEIKGIFHKGNLATAKYVSELYSSSDSKQWGNYCPLPPKTTQGGEPLQTKPQAEMKAVHKNGYKLFPIAGYSIYGRVVQREDYSSGQDAMAKYSEMDLGIGWGAATNPANTRGISFSNSGRSMQTKVSNSRRYFGEEVAFSNNHIIAGSPAILQKLKTVKNGNIVTLHGWLVMTSTQRGKLNFSSFTRSDSGSGSGEILLVCEVDLAPTQGQRANEGSHRAR